MLQAVTQHQLQKRLLVDWMTKDTSDIRVVSERENVVKRRNDLVTISPEDSDKEEAHKSIKPKWNRRTSAPKLGRTSSTTLHLSKTPTLKTVKKELLVISISSANNNDSDHLELPAFICTKWETEFLPMLYHCFFASEQPFAILTKGSPELMDTINKTLDAVTPKHSYIVKKGTKMPMPTWERRSQSWAAVRSGL
ncbi:hypothetical protein B0H34DRAFT_797182 [Crassisporium funariophilum]|nr:hypothetical protein B0H34DRAFT_797182 [Crassisporium funariophilum]